MAGLSARLGDCVILSVTSDHVNDSSHCAGSSIPISVAAPMRALRPYLARSPPQSHPLSTIQRKRRSASSRVRPFLSVPSYQIFRARSCPAPASPPKAVVCTFMAAPPGGGAPCCDSVGQKQFRVSTYIRLRSFAESSEFLAPPGARARASPDLPARCREGLLFSSGPAPNYRGPPMNPTPGQMPGPSRSEGQFSYIGLAVPARTPCGPLENAGAHGRMSCVNVPQT